MRQRIELSEVSHESRSFQAPSLVALENQPHLLVYARSSRSEEERTQAVSSTQQPDEDAATVVHT